MNSSLIIPTVTLDIQMPAATVPLNWRTGSKVKLNVYKNGRPVCQCHNEEDATEIVNGMNGVEEPIVEEGPGYRLSVIDCHEALDTLGIPTAKGQECLDPKCKSPVGHRVRELGKRYLGTKAILDELRENSNLTPADFFELAKALLSESREH